MAKSVERDVVKQAEAAAEKRRGTKEPLKFSDALAEAPWDKVDFPAPWEDNFRRAYATALVSRGLALPAGRPGKSGASGESLLKRRTLRCSPEEFAAHDKEAKAAGIPWNTWVRRKLSGS